jgi:hypothetical protein
MKIKLLHILKIIKVLTLTLIILSCSNKEIASHDLKKGVYAWREQNIFKSYYYLYLNKTNFEIGDTLTLLDNSDFKYTNCGFFGFGKYLIEGDSLYLNFDSTASHFDSVLTEDKMAFIYFIEDENTISNKLSTRSTRDGKADSYTISELHYVKNSQNVE